MKNIKRFNEKNYQNISELTRCHITSDDDGHQYLIPYDMKEHFNSLLDKLIETDYSDNDLMKKWDDDFGKYSIGGSLELIEIYTIFKDK